MSFDLEPEEKEKKTEVTNQSDKSSATTTTTTTLFHPGKLGCDVTSNPIPSPRLLTNGKTRNKEPSVMEVSKKSCVNYTRNECNLLSAGSKENKGLKNRIKSLFSTCVYLKRPMWTVSPKWLLACLCFSAVIQGMIFTNVVISSIERRFNLQSTQSGIIAGSYDMGSLLAVIPVTYLGGRPGASKPKYIALGMFVMGSGSLLFAAPHFLTERYTDFIMDGSIKGIQEEDKRGSSSRGFCISGLANNQLSNSSTKSSLESGSDLKSESPSTLSHYQYVFIAAQLLHGIGAAALTTLGTTLIDESLPRKTAPLYIGIFEASFVLGPALGYVIGGRLLNLFTEFYLAEAEETIGALTTDSPDWIGAWWLGFLIILVLSYISAFLLAAFPKVLPSAPSRQRKEKEIINNDYYDLMKALPKALYDLLSNATYMFISLGATMDGFLLAGMAAFLPKYFESQFQLSPGDAAMLVGVIVVPAGAGGTIIGGYVAKRLKLNRAGTIKMYILCQAIVIPLYFGFLMYCPNGPFAGLTVPTEVTSSSNQPSISHISTRPDFGSECNANCACSLTEYNPVCFVERQVTFYNPCFAGCSQQQNNANGSLIQCSCIARSLEHDVSNTEPGTAVLGPCESHKCNPVYFCIFIFLQVFFTFAATMPGLVASLRSVEHSQRSLSLGLQTILLRAFGTVPGPIVFGFIMDQTCMLWRTTGSNSSTGEPAENNVGSCLVYNNFYMTLAVLVMCLVWRLAGAIFFAISLHYNKTCQVLDIDEDDLEKEENVPGA